VTGVTASDVTPDATRIEPLGDSALLVILGDRPDPILTTRAHALTHEIEAARAVTAGLGRPVPAHASVLVPFDPLTVDAEAIRAMLAELVRRRPAAAAATARDDEPLEIPVRYGGADGPDLEELAGAHDLRPDDVIDLHRGASYRVLFLGFAPGFAYLGGLPAALVTPRRATPRERVPAGRVAIAGEHSGVDPRSMPGGWNLIGRTDDVLFDPAADPPSPLRPGRTVKFVPR
jgi:KipI family sensor histidine kinase inhibitor